MIGIHRQFLRHGYLVRTSTPVDHLPVGGDVVLVTITALRSWRTVKALVFENRLFLLSEFIMRGQYTREVTRLRMQLRDRGRAGGLVIVDAGANVGLFPLFVRFLLAGDVALSVIGFEPFSENRRLCALNWERNDLSFQVRAEALSDASAAAMPLHLLSTTGATINPAEVEWYLRAKGTNREVATETVSVTTLDAAVGELGIPRVDLLKLDIEGAEDAALAGASATIARDHPYVVCSYEHDQNDKSRIAAIVTGCGDYEIHDNPTTHLLTFVPCGSS